jgi:hypothetical protein
MYNSSYTSLILTAAHMKIPLQPFSNIRLPSPGTSSVHMKTLLASSYSGRLASRNSIDLKNRLWTFHNPSTGTMQKIASLLLRRVSGPLHSNGRGADQIENSCSIVAWIRHRGNVFHSNACFSASFFEQIGQNKFGRTCKNYSFLKLSSWRYNEDSDVAHDDLNNPRNLCFSLTLANSVVWFTLNHCILGTNILIILCLQKLVGLKVTTKTTATTLHLEKKAKIVELKYSKNHNRKYIEIWKSV